jgi:CRISPR/Cas system-associated exonuclease Cas4 (RecB family)
MQFKLVEVHQVPFTNVYMQDGIWFHDIVNRFFDYIGEEVNPSRFETILRKLAGERYDIYKLWFDNFIEFEKERFARLPRNHYLPKLREVKIVLNGMSGIIDRIDYEPSDGIYVAIDYKTGKMTSIKKHIFEMTVYAYMFREQFKKHIPRVAIFSAGDGKFTEMTITEEYIEEMQKVVKQVRENVTDEYFPLNPKNCWGCPENVKALCHTINKEEWINYNQKLSE